MAQHAHHDSTYIHTAHGTHRHTESDAHTKALVTSTKCKFFHSATKVSRRQFCGATTSFFTPHLDVPCAQKHLKQYLVADSEAYLAFGQVRQPLASISATPTPGRNTCSRYCVCERIVAGGGVLCARALYFSTCVFSCAFSHVRAHVRVRNHMLCTACQARVRVHSKNKGA